MEEPPHLAAEVLVPHHVRELDPRLRLLGGRLVGQQPVEVRGESRVHGEPFGDLVPELVEQPFTVLIGQ